MSESEYAERPAMGWTTDTLGAICRSGGGSIQTGPFGSQLHAEDYKEEGTPIITVEHLKEGRIAHENLPLVGKEDCRRLHRYKLSAGDLVFSRVGAIDRCALVSDTEQGWLFSGRCLRVRAGNGEADSRFLSYLLNSFNQRQWILNHSVGSTMACLNTAILSSVPIAHPALPQQRKIARILTTVDNLIEKTEALIAKYQAIKQGMMHDLFTRGVDEHGHLRPPYEQAPELYKQSELGWIPKEWRVTTLADMAESAIDGPFGSNLKTEHYVSEAGVRVIRLQNIETGNYDDSDRAFISDSHAGLLSRHRVISGDVMVAGMGEEKHPVARACLYPAELPPAINKADCFRIRCKAEHMENSFLMLSLNAHYLRPWIERFAQGVTRTRINVRNLKALPVKVPPLTEQKALFRRMFAVAAAVQELETEKQKLLLHKTGLMQDLLTGKIRVTVDEAEEVAAHA